MSALANTAVAVLLVLGVVIDVALLALGRFGRDATSVWQTNEPYLVIAVLLAILAAPFAAAQLIGTAAVIAAVGAVIVAVLLAGAGVYRSGRGATDAGDASFSYGP